MANSKPNRSSTHDGQAHSLSHVMPLSLLFGVFTALVLLTLLTVVAAQFSFGAWEVWVSLGIATIKAALVAIYFMHLRYDRLPFGHRLRRSFSSLDDDGFADLILTLSDHSSDRERSNA